MYLKSLTLKGFKSFASSTTLQLEPGITCIVGPNGSGKSNVVDALAWVMGEQGAKSLRGGKMEDVIFAGTSGRPPLGRAEVLLTIDNSDGALPIEYAEVTISRTMFRSRRLRVRHQRHARAGCSTSRSCSATPASAGRCTSSSGRASSTRSCTRPPRTAAASSRRPPGVLKHRKRKEKALRKLDATDGNLMRLGDLLSEIRRQLKPLGRQAEVARQAATVQADARDARARLMADDLVTARTALEQEMADETILVELREQVEAQLASFNERETALETSLRDDLPVLSQAQDTWFALSGLRERLRGTQSLATERLRNAASAEAEPAEAGRDPDQLEAEAAQVREQEQVIGAEVETHRTTLEQAVTGRRTAEEAAAEEERRVAGLVRAAADRREGLARLHGQVNALRTRAAAADDEIGRLRDARQDAAARVDRAQRDFTALETKVAGLDAGEEGLDAEHESAVALLDDVTARLEKARDEVAARRPRAVVAGRPHGSPRDGPQPPRRRGCAARRDRPRLRPARLGGRPAVGAVGVRDRRGRGPRLGRRRGGRDRPGRRHRRDRPPQGPRPRPRRAGAGWWPDLDEDSWPGLPSHASYAVDAVECPDELRPSLVRLLHKVAVVDDLSAARALVAELPDVTAVTREGDVLGAFAAAGGSSSQPSLLEIQAAVDEASAQLLEATAVSERLGFDISRLESERLDAQQRVDVALAKLHESDATLAAVAEQLGQFGSQARSARSEAERLDTAIGNAESARDQDLAGLADLEQRLSDRRVGSRRGARHDRAGAAGRGRPRGPRSRDGGSPRAADVGGARPRAARPGRLAARRRPGRA